MRFFDQFPNDSICPICKTNENKSCFLMPIDGTNKGNICEAQPTHKHCIEQMHNKLRWNKNVGVIYFHYKWYDERIKV